MDRRSFIKGAALLACVPAGSAGYCGQGVRSAEYVKALPLAYDVDVFVAGGGPAGVAAVNLGGDSDSIGAIYGQIAGAYYGFDAIPPRWVKAVKTPEAIEALVDGFVSTLERA